MFDAYSRRARLAPAALAALPAIVLVGSGVVGPADAASILAMALGTVGIVLCGLVRDAGRRIQPDLWARWGGSPTLRRLRWRNATDPAAVERLHRRIEAVVDERLPTEDEEIADQAATDRRYDEATATLRELTRSREDFPLVFEENAEYGFRRNCLGIRPFALGVAAAVVVVSAGLLLAGEGRVRFWAALATGLVALLGWERLVNDSWIKAAAELYADRLFEAVASLSRRES